MADQVTAPIEFEARFDKALRGLEDFLGQVDKTTKKSGNSMAFLEKAAVAFVAKFTVDKVIDGLKAIVGAASEAEESTFRLTQALEATGSNTANNVRLFKEFAKQMERTSRFDDDTILSQVALAKQFGVTNREAVKLIRTAVNLSSVTGDDLSTSVRNLGQTLDGNAGRFARQFPVLQRLTAEQLRNGAAIDLIAKLYGGAAAQSLTTFEGKTAQLSNAFGNLLEALGQVITENPKLVENLTKLTNTLVTLTEYVERGGGSLGKFSKVVTMPNVGIGAKALNALVGSVDVITTRLFGTTKATDAAEKGFKKAGDAFKGAKDKMNGAFDESRIKFDRFANETRQKFEDLSKQLENTGRTELESLTNQYEANRRIIEKQISLGYGDQRKAVELLGRLELKYVREANELRKKAYQELQGLVQDAYQNPINALVNGGRQNYNRGPLSDQQAVGLSAGLGIGSNVLKGKEGARDIIGAAASAAGVAFLGPAGAALGDVAKELTKGPEYVKQMIREFADALPDLIVNLIQALVEALPVVFEKIPQIIEKLAERSPEIIEAIIKSLPKLFANMPKYWLTLGTAFVRGSIKAFNTSIGKGFERFFADIGRGASKFVSELVRGAGRFIEELVRGIGKQLSKLFEGVGGLGGGGGGGFLGRVFGGGKGSLLGSVAGGSVGGVVGAITGGLFKGGAGPISASQAPLQPVVLQIGNKQLASALIDLQKLGFNFA